MSVVILAYVFLIVNVFEISTWRERARLSTNKSWISKLFNVSFDNLNFFQILDKTNSTIYIFKMNASLKKRYSLISKMITFLLIDMHIWAKLICLKRIQAKNLYLLEHALWNTSLWEFSRVRNTIKIKVVLLTIM